MEVITLLRLGRRRLFRGTNLRRLLIVLVLSMIVAMTEVLSIHSALSRAALDRPRVFIVGIHWNNEQILRSHWIHALIALTREIGPENVFVSIYESGSWDDTKGALRLLDNLLEERGIPRRIILDNTTHLDEISKSPSVRGWIKTSRSKTELRRIPYLAQLRNVAMQPLYDMQNAALAFDKILFLNDVVFESSDIHKLLSTNDGDYAAACALDFSKPPAFYDTFALRDSEGHEAVMQEWPYFRSWTSLKALKNGQPTPVTSCWNGVVAMNAEPFYRVPRLVFRGVPDSLASLHVEASECCLIHADNPYSSTDGVWLNPNVRVGYSSHAYREVHPEGSNSWIPLYWIARGLWINRLMRWFSSPWLKELVVKRRVDQWVREHPNSQEVGTSCLINEMQVLAANGWAHV
ncbi:hypothetical protein D6D11_10322 [Aureobasidium pullulans]|nr:hypothetical protein D6D11_10322 [Aureobasidium pullulans]